MYPQDLHFDLTRIDDDVSVETDIKEENFIEEKKEIEQLSCDICERKLKRTDSLKRHNQRFHIL